MEKCVVSRPSHKQRVAKNQRMKRDWATQKKPTSLYPTPSYGRQKKETESKQKRLRTGLSTGKF